MALPLVAVGSLASSVAVAIVAYLAEAAKSIVGRVLIALGMGVVTSTGMTAVLNAVLSMGSHAALGTGLVADLFAHLGMSWFLSTIYSALVARMTLRGLTSDSVSFWVMRKGLPGS